FLRLRARPHPPLPMCAPPRRRRLCPSPAPAVTLTCSLVWFRISPEPPQFLHGFSTIVPSPLHRGQVVIWIICAKPERRTCCTWPRPLHVLQVFRWLPGWAPEPPHTLHCARRGTSMSLLTPLAASSKLIAI